MSPQQLASRSPLQQELLSAERNTSPRLSPDGRVVVFVRTADAGQEVWLRMADSDGGAERRLASHHGHMIGDIQWTGDSSTVVYRYTERGREHWSLAALRIGSGKSWKIPANGSVTEHWLSPQRPGVVAYSCRNTRLRSSELFEADLTDPDREPVLIAADAGFHRWLVDRALRPRGGIRLARDGSVHIHLGDDLASARTVLSIALDDAADLSTEGFSRDGSQLFVLTGSDAPTRRLIAIDAASGAVSTVFEHPRLDVGSYPIAGQGVWFDPATGQPDICTVMGQRLEHHALAPERQGAVAHLTAGAEAPVIIDRSADDRRWLVVHVHDDGPISYRLLDPAAGESRTVLLNRPELAGHRLPTLEDFFFTAGDGLPLSGYAMRPLDREPPFATVVMMHGGPAGRDYWRFYAEAQYLASLGYLSLHINYRGSSGFGRAFRLAGNGEWGGRMQQDLYDAVASAASAGLADPSRVAFFGASYGGYAALLGACARPDLVRCAIAISPPCDLVSLTRTPPAYWQPLSALLRSQIVGSRDGRELGDGELEQRSPVHVLDESCAPVLVAHGVRDPRVAVAEVDQLVDRARTLGIPVRYLRFEDEGHHVKSNVNRELLFSEIDAFLEEYLAHP